MIERSILLVGLGAASIQDIKYKQVWLPMIWVITFSAMLKKFVEGKDIFLWLSCPVLSIIFFLIIYKFTQGQIGVGDAFIFGMTGSVLGWENNFILIYTTFFLAFMVSLFLVCVWKKSKKYKVPLCPFVLLAYFMVG